MKVRIIKRLFCFITISALMSGICSASAGDSEGKLPVEVSASVDKDKITIGEKVTYTL